MSEGSKFFEERSAVQEALRKITAKLDALGIPYAVSGGMALFRHGYHRFTDDVDILVSREGLKEIHSKLDGLGYLPLFRHSKNLRDTELKVRIEFLVAGAYPGDGRPKPVSFPDPTEASVELDGIKYLSLSRLVELKLASGMTDPGRMKDLSDVLELIKILDLREDFADGLNPFVRAKYAELCMSARKRYMDYWRNKWLTANAMTIDDMITSLRAAAETLEGMRDAGVVLDPTGGTADDYALLMTTDPNVAKKFGMIEEGEFFGEDDLPGED